MGYESPPTLPVAKPGGEAGWRSREDFGAILKNPEAAIHIKEAAQIARSSSHTVRVSFVDEGPGSCAHVRTIKSDPRRKFRGPYPSECYAGIWSSSTSAFTTEEAEG